MPRLLINLQINASLILAKKENKTKQKKPTTNPKKPRNKNKKGNQHIHVMITSLRSEGQQGPTGKSWSPLGNSIWTCWTSGQRWIAFGKPRISSQVRESCWGEKCTQQHQLGNEKWLYYDRNGLLRMQIQASCLYMLKNKTNKQASKKCKVFFYSQHGLEY